MRKVGTYIEQKIGQAIEALESGDPLSEEMRRRIADELKQTDQQLDKVRSWMSSAESLADIWTWVVDHQRDKLFWSDQTYRILGCDPEEISPSFEAYSNRMAPEELERVQQEFKESLENKHPFEVTYQLKLPNGPVKYVQAQASHFYNEEGEPVSTVGTSQDVTDRMREKQRLEGSLKENRTLLGEIHHRIKNNLPVVAGLLQLEWLQEEDPVAVNTLKKSARRIEAVAGIHQQLYESGDYLDVALGDNIANLASGIVDMMEPDVELKLVTNCDTVYLTMDQTLPCTLIANEVVTNSIKHAFEGTAQGTIAIDLTTSDDLVKLGISDNGVGLPDDYNNREGSLGINLIETLSDQLEADVNFSSSEEGTTFTLQFQKE